MKSLYLGGCKGESGCCLGQAGSLRCGIGRNSCYLENDSMGISCYICKHDLCGGDVKLASGDFMVTL